MVRIVVDGRALTDASAYRGIGTYLRNIVAGLAAEPDVAVSVLSTRADAVPDGASTCGVARHAPGRFAVVEHDLLLPWDLRRCAGDVVHSPAMDPPRRSSRPWVQTLHDLVPLMSDNDDRSTTRWRRRLPRLHGAAAVIAVSRWVADTAVDLLGLDPATVHVVPHGVSPAFRPAAERERSEPYVLFVGEYDARKRHDVAFEAIGRLAARGLPHRLVVVGRIAPWFAGTLQALVAASPAPERIELRGYVDERELVRLYQQADALLVTSTAEGFGFPALESMACGTPVVGFRNSATAEVVGDAGFLVDDGDVEALVDGLDAVVAGVTRAVSLRAAAIERAAQFTWSASVARHRAVFESVAA
jgi:glycosyltransferase involved in cell wall biosynthesis